MTQPQENVYPSYEPNAEQKYTVLLCQVYGAPDKVEYVNRGAYATSAISSTDKNNEIWFTSRNGTQYIVNAQLLVDWPYSGIGEMGGSTLQMLLATRMNGLKQDQPNA